MNEQMISTSEDGSFYYGWATLSIINLPQQEPMVNMVSGAYASFTVRNGVGKGIEGQLNGGGTFTAYAMDIFGYVDFDYGLRVGMLFYGGESGEEDAYLYAGEQTWTRISEDILEDTPTIFPTTRKASSVNMPSFVAL